MKIIYIFTQSFHGESGCGGYARGWLNPDNWYNAGCIAARIIQFLAGVGIGFTIKCVLKALGLF